MLDRTVAPPFLKNASFNLLKPEEETLPNGIDLFFITGGSQDVLKIELVFEAGRWFEEKTAASYFAANMLAKGTRNRTSFEIASIFDQYGAHLEVNPGLDFVSISLYALSKNLEPVLALLAEILTAPAFPGKEFSQTKAVFIQNLNINNEKTSFVSSHLFRKSLFGDNHPYGIAVEEDHVHALSIDDLHKHFTNFLHSPRVFVSGKIDEQNRARIVAALQDLPAGKRTSPVAIAESRTPHRQYVEKKDSVQSSVRMGTKSTMRTDPDYVLVLFVSHILGGYFGSRLMKNIREEKGLTYGISASVHGLRHDSYLVIGADVNRENVDLTFSEIAAELKELRTDNVSSDELETTRNHFIGSLQSEITTPFAHAEKIKTISLFNLPLDHYQKMIARIERITPAEIRAISERYFHEDSFLRIAVG